MNYNVSYGLKDVYEKIILEVKGLTTEEIIKHLDEKLPHLWVDAYHLQNNKMTDICIISHGAFEYIFDDYASLENKGLVQEDTVSDSRLVVVSGRSFPRKVKRDDYRLRGWVGKTESLFGKDWDKGHYIAHSLGGNVDGLEVNVFQQRRDVNRGWSEPGKIFRKMEKSCFENPGSFCFNRPIYLDTSFKPSFYEFGILTQENQLWVEMFDNR